MRRTTEHSFVEQEPRSVARESAGFDRIGFAMRALKVLRPRGLTVAVHESRFELRVSSGRAWGKQPDARWAIVSIPPDASREHIAIALAQLVGLGDRPFVLQTLLSAPRAQRQ